VPASQTDQLMLWRDGQSHAGVLTKRLMSVDLMLPAGEKIVRVLEGIGNDKIRVNSSNLDHPLTILPDQAIEIVANREEVMLAPGRSAGRCRRQRPP
jgi:hypothetical protein